MATYPVGFRPTPNSNTTDILNTTRTYDIRLTDLTTKFSTIPPVHQIAANQRIKKIWVLMSAQTAGITGTVTSAVYLTDPITSVATDIISPIFSTTSISTAKNWMSTDVDIDLNAYVGSWIEICGGFSTAARVATSNVAGISGDSRYRDGNCLSPLNATNASAVLPAIYFEIEDSIYAISSLNDGNPIKAGQTFNFNTIGYTTVTSGNIAGKALIINTFASNVGNATAPSPVDGQSFYKVSTPTTSYTQNVTISDGTNPSSLVWQVSPLDGYSVVDLVNPITNDPTYPTYYYSVVPVTGDQQWINTAHVTSQTSDGGIIAPSAAVTTMYHWVAATGIIYQYTVTINEDGEIIDVIPTRLTYAVGRVEAIEAMATFRSKLPFQASSVASNVAGLRTDFNLLLSKMRNNGWFNGGDESLTTMKIALQNGLLQFLKRLKQTAPDQMVTQSDSVAADVTALRTDFNALLTKLKTANLMASS